MAKRQINLADRLTVTTSELKELLGVGRGTAVSIGMAAQARIVTGGGTRYLWDVRKIDEYLYTISSGWEDDY